MLKVQTVPRMVFRERREREVPFSREGLLEIFNEAQDMKEYCGKAINLNFYHAIEAPQQPVFKLENLDIPSSFELSSEYENDSTLDWVDQVKQEDISWEERSMTNSYYEVATVRSEAVPAN